MARLAPLRELNECRRCATFCDRVIAPATCVAASCPGLYSYDDPLTGRRYMGCIDKVFGVEIDTELFRAAERTKLGFGSVRVTGTPRARCSWYVERAHNIDDGPCQNRRFGDFPDTAADAVRAFDLRDRL